MAAVHGLSIKGQKIAHAMEAARLHAFRASLADDLQGGLCIMLVAALYCAFSYGFLEIRLGRCDPEALFACD